MFEFANQLVMKVTKGCNLRCEYCYVKDKDEHQNEFIDYELFKKTINRIVEEKAKADPRYRNTEFHITFHGGEPTMLDKKIFYRMCEYAEKKFLDYNIPMQFSMQTNLTLIDEEWCRLFNKFNVNLGASWDGVDGANDSRTNKSIESYLQKIDMIKKFNVNIGFLIVVNQQSMPYYDKSIAFLRERYNQGAKANYVEDVFTPLGDKSPIEVRGEDFFNQVIKKEIDQFIDVGNTRESNAGYLIQKFIIDYLTNLGNFYSLSGNCYIKYCGSGINVIELNPDGTVQLCGRYGDNKDSQTIVGHVLDPDFLSMYQIQRHLEFTKSKIKAMKKSHCDDCLAQNICDHGCMAFYFSKTGEWGIRNDLTCGMFKPTYDYLLVNAQKIFDSLFTKKLRNPSDEFLVPLPTNDAQHFSIFGNKIEDVLKKHGVTVTNDSFQLIFKKGDNNVKCNTNP